MIFFYQTSNSIGQANVGSSNILTQNASSGTYIIQSSVEPDTSHTILSGSRSSPQTVAAVRNLFFDELLLRLLLLIQTFLPMLMYVVIT